MPHFTIEYSANIEPSVDIGALCEVVRLAAIETTIFPLGGIRVRAIKCEHYAIADGRPNFGFLDMVLRLGEGRDLATRQKAGEHIFEVLSAHLDPVFANSKFALSFDMQINDKQTSWKKPGLPRACSIIPRHPWRGLPTRSRRTAWHLKPARSCWRDRSSGRSRPAKATPSRPTMVPTAR